MEAGKQICKGNIRDNGRNRLKALGKTYHGIKLDNIYAHGKTSELGIYGIGETITPRY